MNYPVIAKQYRNNVLENVHHGMVCIVDEHKEILYEVGDSNQYIFYRSALKPIQAIPVFTTAFRQHYEITDEEAALCMASQRGESYHQEALLHLAEKLKVTDDHMVCAHSYPLNETPKEAYIAQHKPKRKVFHNCAGKHLGFLAYTKELGLDMEGYNEIDHPLQQEVLSILSDLSEVPQQDIKYGIDGCGVPVYAVPLKHMAISYLKFVKHEEIEDAEKRKAVEEIGRIMNAYPNMIASHDFICSNLLQDSNIIAKGGAQGVYCLALRKERISIALKVLSGSEDVWPQLVATILQKINYQNQETIERLLSLHDGAVLNDGGKTVGKTEIILD